MVAMKEIVALAQKQAKSKLLVPFLLYLLIVLQKLFHACGGLSITDHSKDVSEEERGSWQSMEIF